MLILLSQLLPLSKDFCAIAMLDRIKQIAYSAQPALPSWPTLDAPKAIRGFSAA